MYPRLRRFLMLVLVLSAASLRAAEDKQENNAKHTVTIDDKKFKPAKITIKVGQTVLWKNDDVHDHTVVAKNGSFKSGNISPDKTFSHTFKKKGEFSYSCTYHPRMKGVVVVE